ncbi:MAG: hypothetical protein K0S07_431 [Chlamydiales bacterium]|nr:hypothetical protein [Chlamydiales bacterium]
MKKYCQIAYCSLLFLSSACSSKKESITPVVAQPGSPFVSYDASWSCYQSRPSLFQVAFPSAPKEQTSKALFGLSGHSYSVKGAKYSSSTGQQDLFVVEQFDMLQRPTSYDGASYCYFSGEKEDALQIMYYILSRRGLDVQIESDNVQPNLASFRFSAKEHKGGAEYRMLGQVIAYGSNAYIVSYSYPAHRAEALKGNFDAFINSFNLIDAKGRLVLGPQAPENVLKA